jgi:hypothetical protein
MSDRDETGPKPAWRAPGWERNIYDRMEAIRTHLQLWIGERTIHSLVLFLIGYQDALKVHRIEERDCPPSELFMGWLDKRRHIPPERGLDDEFLHEAGGDNEIALENFFKLFAEFGRFRVVLGEFVDIPRGHKWMTLVPLATRIQLGYLHPGEWCFRREWIADRMRNTNHLYDDGRAAKNAVECEYEITPDMWSPASMLLEGDG